MSYLKNKKSRLKTKYSNILLKDLGIEMSQTPTNVIVICNGGLGNGITYDMVYKAFEKFGNLENVFMVPGKSYSFVTFKDITKATEAFDGVNGEKIWTEVKGPIYLGYAQNFNPSLLQQVKNFKHPPGLILIDNFITEQEEKLILDLVGFNASDNKNSSELKNRKVKHFGYEFKYSNNNVDLSEPIDDIPKELNFLWDRLKKYLDECGCNINFIPDQLTVNFYEPGQGIPPHVDTHSAFEDGILSLSLLSPIVMEFKNQNEMCCDVVLPRRSFCLMLGESRYGWTHGITPRKTDVVLNEAGALTFQNRELRISLTFRKTRRGECNCKYPTYCDSFLKKLQTENVISDMKQISLHQKVASELEGNYVHEVYEKIASHFSETRHKPWPNVTKFLKSFDVGSVIVDVGCGNGKYFSHQSEHFEIGCDSSQGLIQVCKQSGFECFSCNCLNIPIRDNMVDGCICIAVIHHLTTEERRKKAINEIIRILRSKGRALIYVWAKNQEMKNQKSSYLKQSSQREKNLKENSEVQFVSLNNSQEELVLPVHVNRTNFDYNDLLVPWKLKTKNPKQAGNNNSQPPPVYLRFYHVYEDDELRNMCQQIDNVDVIDYYYDQGNWCIILEKQ